ncbi:MAG: glycosyltransferase family 9 protein [Gemmatimonadota bacterium]
MIAPAMPGVPGVAAAPQRLVVRAPNHLGELVLALPALERSAARERAAGRPPPLLVVPAWLEPVCRMAGLDAGIFTLSPRRAVWRDARRLRRAARGSATDAVTLTPSFSSALTLRLAGVRSLRGTAGGGRTWLLSESVDRSPLLEGHRVNEFLVLCGFDAQDPPPPPTLRRADPKGDSGTRRVALFPGANGPARRWPADRFAALARRLATRGIEVLVCGGPGDAALTAEVAAAPPAAARRIVDLGGRTTLLELAEAVVSCDVFVTNDTGPMHLAAALGTSIVALEGPADLRQTRPLGDRVRTIGRFDLPCVPCVKNECPRRGAGYELAEARRECMRLIEVDEVESVVNELLS